MHRLMNVIEITDVSDPRVAPFVSLTEAQLHSAYSAPFRPLAPGAPLPWITQAPQSVTDWLFVGYAAGIAAALLWYLAGFVRLRLLLLRCAPASAETQAHVDSVAAAYGLRACRAVSVPGLPSAFVCGAFRPVLGMLFRVFSAF